ncbi:MAG: hypothetical protein KGJ23_14345 [Euryarchaeota archaeon]|nr:hypothetical protein [Euryarchaeota archaeon]MDE1837779.1 hypothetical protein [Euryarchaeota archaeon]MDE1881286.1 hypothetical protein [Euryarchaeota archaeon]MDE2046623.1 hypothetical protein [Thermoplasmata archaeon]
MTYAQPPYAMAPPPAPAYTGSDGSVLVLVAFVFQVLITLLWIWLFSLAGPIGLILIGGFGGGMILLAIFGAIVPLHRKQYATAAPVALILGIIGFIPGLFIVGILYIIAYTQIARARDWANRPQMTAPVEVVYVPAVAPPPPPVLRKCAYCGTDYSVALAACPACGAPP